MMKAESKESRAKRLTEDATRDFENHQIVERSDGRWLIKRPGTGMYWAEIIVCRGGSLFVHGDIGFVLWSSYHDSKNPNDVLRWIGRHPVVDGYTQQKACIGSGQAVAETQDPSVYLHDLQQEMAEMFCDRTDDDGEADDMDEEESDLHEAMEDAIQRVERGDHLQSVSESLYDANMDTEVLASLGRCPDSRVYYAHAAVVQLCALLDEEMAGAVDAAPPAS